MKNYEFLVNNNELYIFLEFADNGTLKKKIRELKVKEKTMSENQVRIYTKEILAGLEYMHCIKGFFHRDIKPENILLNISEDIKISDFGESKFIDNSGGTISGTPAYIAPEVMKNVLKYFLITFNFLKLYFYSKLFKPKIV